MDVGSSAAAMFDVWALLLLVALAWTGLAIAVGLWLGPRIRRSVRGSRPLERPSDVLGPDAANEADAVSMTRHPAAAIGDDASIGVEGPSAQPVAARTAVPPRSH